LIDEVAIWNSALSSAEVTALYNNHVPLSAATNSGNYTSSSNLTLYYTFDSNISLGASIFDDSNNGENKMQTIKALTHLLAETTSELNTLNQDNTNLLLCR